MCGASRVPCWAMIKDEPASFPERVSSITNRYSRSNGSRMRPSNERADFSRMELSCRSSSGRFTVSSSDASLRRPGRSFLWASRITYKRRAPGRSEEYTSELQSHVNLVCRLLLEKKKTRIIIPHLNEKIKKKNTKI